jgi:2-polyprenyl-3-methyl-5-hydroxy-6-metoxy-1,4-benzoquinol methylase
MIIHEQHIESHVASSPKMTKSNQFTEERGILIPPRRPVHRDDEYDEAGFDLLIRMQREHFWYRGRHQLLLNVLKREVRANFGETNSLRAIDLGGGCGGWLEYLQHHAPGVFHTPALGDSSIRALTLAEPVVGSFAERYQVDLLDLNWHEEWDVVFLLDVLEHIPDHVEVLKQIRKTLKPGGLLFVTTPALNFFWTRNDDLARHQRRYSRRDFRHLAREADLELLRADYFMFFLSPALMLYRMMIRPHKLATPGELQEYLWRSHQVPGRLVNSLLTQVFLAEAALVNHIAMPWGTSILAVFRR